MSYQSAPYFAQWLSDLYGNPVVHVTIEAVKDTGLDPIWSAIVGGGLTLFGVYVTAAWQRGTARESAKEALALEKSRRHRQEIVDIRAVLRSLRGLNLQLLISGGTRLGPDRMKEMIYSRGLALAEIQCFVRQRTPEFQAACIDLEDAERDLSNVLADNANRGDFQVGPLRDAAKAVREMSFRLDDRLFEKLQVFEEDPKHLFKTITSEDKKAFNQMAEEHERKIGLSS